MLIPRNVRSDFSLRDFHKSMKTDRSNFDHTMTANQKITAPFITPTDLSAKATKDICGAINPLLADVFAI